MSRYNPDTPLPLTVAGIAIAAAAVYFVTCGTDARRSKLEALGRPATVHCWSGGQDVIASRSTGRVDNSEGGVYAWRDSATGRLYETTADCIVIHDR